MGIKMKSRSQTICVGAAYTYSQTQRCCEESKEDKVEWVLLLIHMQRPQHCKKSTCQFIMDT
ncbi:hypothetical protein Hanom_Chr03g00251211 [Helianthus anomalus]